MKVRLEIIAVALAFTTVAWGGDDKSKCTAAAKECEYQIRETLSHKRHLGVRVEDSRWGVVVTYVIPGSPAEAADLRVGDRIFAVNGRETGRGGTRQFKAILNEAATKQDGKVYLSVVRIGRLHRLAARMAVMTKEEIDKVVAAHLKEAHQDQGQ